jgi:ankyrin repeat protein
LVKQSISPLDYRLYYYGGVMGWAVRNSKIVALASLLQDERVDPSIEDNFAIRFASERGYKEIVKLLLQGTKRSYYNSDCIAFISFNIVLNCLLDDRVDPSAKGNSPLGNACESGQLEIVEVLLQDGRIDPSAQNNWAIQESSRGGYKEIVKLLLQDERVDPSAKGNYAIRFASRFGHKGIVKCLLQGKP